MSLIVFNRYLYVHSIILIRFCSCSMKLIKNIKEEWERKTVFNFACRAYSFYILISELFNFKIMQRKRGVTGLDFSLDPSLCMFLTYFSNQSIIA